MFCLFKATCCHFWKPILNSDFHPPKLLMKSGRSHKHPWLLWCSCQDTGKLMPQPRWHRGSLHRNREKPPRWGAQTSWRSWGSVFFGPNPNPMQTWIQPCWNSQSFRRSKILHDYNLVNPIMNYPQYRGLWNWVYLYDWFGLWHWACHITNIGYLIVFIFIQYLFWLLGHVQTPPQAHKIHQNICTPHIQDTKHLMHPQSAPLDKPAPGAQAMSRKV